MKEGSSGGISPQDTALLSQRRKGPPICWHCNEVGHVQKYCYIRKRKSSHGATVVEEDLDTNGERAFATPVSDDECWLVESGASSHMACNKKYFSSFRKFDKPEDVHLGDGRVVQALGVGSIHLKMTFKVSRPKLATMYDVLYVLRLACNLFSV